jgi:hypothetical protein
MRRSSAISLPDVARLLVVVILGGLAILLMLPPGVWEVIARTFDISQVPSRERLIVGAKHKSAP